MKIKATLFRHDDEHHFFKKIQDLQMIGLGHRLQYFTYFALYF